MKRLMIGAMERPPRTKAEAAQGFRAQLLFALFFVSLQFGLHAVARVFTPDGGWVINITLFFALVTAAVMGTTLASYPGFLIAKITQVVYLYEKLVARMQAHPTKSPTQADRDRFMEINRIHHDIDRAIEARLLLNFFYLIFKLKRMRP